jgi:tetraacyldisaccharide-1-P 4'-kinase
LKKAQAVVVTKCTNLPSEVKRAAIRSLLKVTDLQILVFTGIRYEMPLPIHSNLPAWDSSMKCVAFAGLANPSKFFQQAQEISRAIVTRKFLDHKSYSSTEAEHLRQDWINFGREETRLLTTFKDAVKCMNNEAFSDLPIYYLPMEMTCLHGEEELMQAITNVLNH